MACSDSVDKSNVVNPVSSNPKENGNSRDAPMVVQQPGSADSADEIGSMDCIGTGLDVECMVSFQDGDNNAPRKTAERAKNVRQSKNEESEMEATLMESVLSTLLLISPFFFWGTAMVAMKGVLPKAGPMFVAATRLIPAGALLVGFARYVLGSLLNLTIAVEID